MDALALEFADVVVEIVSSDPAAHDWLAEFLDPWWTRTARVADWRVRIAASASRYAAAVNDRPARTDMRDCFLFDQQVFALPAWETDGRTTVEDAERSLYFTVSAGQVEVVADPSTNRWRFPLVWILTEIAAARLRGRGRGLDLHAAAVEGCGHVVVIAGPKLSGKTTLALHLLAAGAPWVGNDRVFLDGIGAVPRVRGVPSAVKLRPDTVVRFPELGHLASVDRPYLLSEAEFAEAERSTRTPTEFDLAFTPAQVAHRLGVDRVSDAPLGAYVFPEIRADVQGWDALRLPTDEVAAALASSVYGGRRQSGTTTLFEAIEGGAVSPTTEQIEDAARRAPGYRIVLGPDAYEDGELAAWILGSGPTR